jgi:Domain of unknown function (DUF1917)
MSTWTGRGFVWVAAPDWHDCIQASPGKGAYVGKWLLFAGESQIGQAWELIARATESGRLGGESKRSEELARGAYVICVYTLDYRDLNDVGRVLVVLRELGFNTRIFYKEDAATCALRYGGGSASLYEAPAGSTQIRRRREPVEPELGTVG